MICMIRELQSVRVQRHTSGSLYVTIPTHIVEKLGLKKGDVLIPIISNDVLVYVTPDRLKEVL